VTQARSRLSTAAVALVLLVSCHGLPKPLPAKQAAAARAPSYAAMKLEELSSLAESDPRAYIEAFSAISARAEPGPGGTALPAGSLEALARAATAGIRADCIEAEAEGDFAHARSLASSLAAAAADRRVAACMDGDAAATAADAPRIVARLYAEEAETLYARGLAAPAFVLYARAIRAGGAEAPDPDELTRWAARALAARDRGALRGYCAALEKAGRGLPEGAAAFIASRDGLAEMRKGVVTLRIDKGMKIEQGVGMPDRVLGSAFFIDASGYLLTNYHVIESEVDPKYEGYSRLSLRVAEDPEARIPAKVVGWDRLLDLALVKADMRPGYVFSLSDDASMTPGDRIFAIGTPVGLESTITSGIVSAVGRDLLQVGDVVQVDAALNPGNSGGPLVDEAGNAVGVVFASLPEFQNLNFAIPSSWVLKVLPGLFRGGELARAWLGLAVSEGRGGLDVTYRHPRSADGIGSGDRLVSIDGVEIDDRPMAQALLAELEPGGLVWARVSGLSGDRSMLRRLGERPFSPIEDAFSLDRRDRLLAPLFGLDVERRPGTLLEPDAFSVLRVWPGTIADEAGLSKDDPIVLRRFYIVEEGRAAVIHIRVKKRKAGFLESTLQIPAPLEVPGFI